MDAGCGRRPALIAYGAGALFMPVLVPPPVRAAASVAEASPYALRYVTALESVCGVGCFAARLAAAGLLAAGAPLPLLVLTTLPACAAGLVLLRRGYRRPTLV